MKLEDLRKRRQAKLPAGILLPDSTELERPTAKDSDTEEIQANREWINSLGEEFHWRRLADAYR